MKADHFLQLARKESVRSNHRRHKLGCVLVRGSRVLGLGHNMLKTHPKSPHEFKSIHAEFMAVLNSGTDLKGATAYIFRQQKNGTPAISRPCEDCWRYLMECGVKEVVYSFEGSFVQEKIK